MAKAVAAALVDMIIINLKCYNIISSLSLCLSLWPLRWYRPLRDAQPLFMHKNCTNFWWPLRIDHLTVSYRLFVGFIGIRSSFFWWVKSTVHGFLHTCKIPYLLHWKGARDKGREGHMCLYICLHIEATAERIFNCPTLSQNWCETTTTRCLSSTAVPLRTLYPNPSSNYHTIAEL